MDIDAGTIISGIAALIACMALWHSFRIQRQLSKDDRMVFSGLQHPELLHQSHIRPILLANVANLGRRKAVVTAVTAQTEYGAPIDVTWSSAIDGVGNPVGAHGLFLVDEKEVTLYIRRNDGNSFTEGSKIFVTHTHATAPQVLTFEGLKAWATFLT